MKTIVKIISTISLLQASSYANASTLAFFDFNDTAIADLSPTNSDPDLTVTPVSSPELGFATTTDNASTNASLNLLNGTGDDIQDAFEDDQFFEFTVSAAAAGTTFDLTELTFDVGRADRGAQDYAIRSSVDGFASNIVFADQAIGTTASPQTLNFDTLGNAADFDNLSTITLAIIFDDRAQNGNPDSDTFIDDLRLTGIVVPEPSSTVLLAIAGTVLATRRRR